MDIPNPTVRDSIHTLRTAQAGLRLLQPDGTPLANQDVQIAQTNHQFLFGTAWFDLPYANGELQGEQQERAQRRFERVRDLCNFVTLPFYWGRFEPVRGQPETRRTLQAARFARDHGLLTKGHTLVWHTVCADWLLPLSNEEIIAAQLARITRDVTDFRGLIDMWDVVNEAVIMPVFDKYDNGITRICKQLGRIPLVRQAFETARAANPNATLLINDFDMSDAYDILIEGLLEAGVKIDVIGIQSHMHQGYWGVEKTLRILSHFERFNLPIHFTETNIVSGRLMDPEIVDLNDFKVTDWPSTPEGEERQAREVLTHYTTLLAHPLVQGITYWDFIDGGWLNAPAGMLRKDASPKPVYEELHRLIKGEWWLPPTRFTTNADGRVSFTGFLGQYEVSFDGQRRAFSLENNGAAEVEVRL